MHTIEKGDLTVAILTAQFLRLRYMVLKPLSELSRYDLVIDRGNGFERVQCKTGRLRRGVVIFNTSSTHHHRGRPSKSYKGDADLFGVYCPENDCCYLVPVGDVPEEKGQLRTIPAKNNQKMGIRDAQKYALL